MRRQIIILLALILAVLPAAAQELQWPEDLKCEQIEYQEPVEVQMYLEAWNDRNYWGMPSPVGNFFYFGTVTFDVCDGVNVVFLEFDTMAVRTCIVSPWGGRFPDICYYMNPKEIVWPIELDWAEGIESYIEYGVEEWGMPMAAYVAEDGANGVLTMGVMEIQLPDGIVWWNDDYTWYKFVVEPKTAERKLPTPRRFQRRLIVR